MTLTGRAHVRYSEAFKIQVANDLEFGKFSSVAEASPPPTLNPFLIDIIPEITKIQ